MPNGILANKNILSFCISPTRRKRGGHYRMILHFLAIASHIPTYDTNSQPPPNSLSPSLPVLLLDWMLISEYTWEFTFVIEVTFFFLLQIVEQYEGTGVPCWMGIRRGTPRPLRSPMRGCHCFGADPSSWWYVGSFRGWCLYSMNLNFRRDFLC